MTRTGNDQQQGLHDEIARLARARWRVAIALSAAVFALYFGFIFAVAFAKETIALQIVPGLSYGILFGAIVIAGAWLSTWAYIAWAHRHFDPRLQAMKASASGNTAIAE